MTGKFLLAVVYIIEACEWAKAKANQATRRAMEAGLEGYFAFLRGKRVTYWGRTGDEHTEWFPGAAPAKSAS